MFDEWEAGETAWRNRLPYLRLFVMEKENEGTCLDCGVWDKDFREHFMRHYGVNGGEYGHYSKAYEFGAASARLKPQDLKSEWEKSHSGAWEQYEDAVHFAWEKANGQSH